MPRTVTWARTLSPTDAAALPEGLAARAAATPADWLDAELDLLLVPLVAFDAYGRRLGHGRGYYDRMLSRCPGLKVGVAFEVQRMTAVPTEAHDVGLDLVVTEARVYHPGKGPP